MIDTELLLREGWSETDLEANRGGRLSPRQLEVLRRRMRRYLRGTLMWTLPIPLIALAGAIIGLAVLGQPGYFVIPAILAVFFLPLLIFVAARVRTVDGDLAGGRVAEVDGPIAGMFVNTATGQSRVRIGSTAMQCYGALWDRGWRQGLHFLIGEHRSGASLRAYYLPRSRLFVAAELTRRPGEIA